MGSNIFKKIITTPFSYFIDWCGGQRKEGKESFTYLHKDCRITVI
jgi:hypothetical protein